MEAWPGERTLRSRWIRVPPIRESARTLLRPSPQDCGTVRTTVLLPVRNGEEWLGACLDSLAAQSRPADEILVVDDGGTDRSIEIVRARGVPGTRIVPGPGQGLAAALALGVEEAMGDLIARQDQDDLSAPDRLERQIRFMCEHPTAVAVGGAARVISQNGEVIGAVRPPKSPEALATRLCIENALVHTTVMFRRDAVLEAGNYWSPGPEPFPEDYHLWSRLVEVGEIWNLPDVLADYRVNTGGIVSTSGRAISVLAGQIAAHNAQRRLDKSGSPPGDASPIANFHSRDHRLKLGEALHLERLLVGLWRSSADDSLFRGLPKSSFARALAWALVSPRRSPTEVPQA